MKKRTAVFIVAVLIGITWSIGAYAAYEPAKVTVNRDDKGVWFIEGEDLYSAFESMGYCVAQDRLWQMETLRRSARGTLSEIFGASQLPTDIFLRTVGYSADELSTGYNGLTEQQKTVLQAYADGVNRSIDEIKASGLALLPFEFFAVATPLGKPCIVPADWSPTDIMAVAILMMRKFDPEALNLNSGQLTNYSLLQELAGRTGSPSLAQDMLEDLRWLNDPAAPTMIPQSDVIVSRPRTKSDTTPSSGTAEAAEEMSKRHKEIIKNLKEAGVDLKLGSLAWVISGAKSESGNPILLSSPQLEFRMGWQAPSNIIEGSIKCPGLEVSGMSMPCLPGIVIGRTPHHTWSMQVGHAHTTDFFVEINPAAVQLHRLETINIAGASPLTIPIWRSVHGPILNPMPCADPAAVPQGKLISWKYAHWGALEFNFVDAIMGLAQADGMAAFGEAVQKVPSSLHFCYADRAGNIAYWMSGKDPVRSSSADPRFAQIAFLQEWPEPVAYKAIAHDSNPARGWYGGWNCKAGQDYDNNNVTDHPYFGPFHRSHVIQDYLSKPALFRFQHIRDLALGAALTESIGMAGNPWKFVSNAFEEAVQSAGHNPERLAAVEMIEAWDGHFVEPESAWISGTVRSDAWVLQNEWILEVLRLTFEDELAITLADLKSESPKHHPALLFQVLLHALAGDQSGIVNRYNWFQDLSASGKPTTSNEIIVLALDNVLGSLGPRPWNRARGEIQHIHSVLKAAGMPYVATTPAALRGTYTQCVEMGPDGPARIESLFPLGESGNIALDFQTGQPILAPNFLSMHELFNSWTYRSFPLFN